MRQRLLRECRFSFLRNLAGCIGKVFEWLQAAFDLGVDMGNFDLDRNGDNDQSDENEGDQAHADDANNVESGFEFH